MFSFQSAWCHPESNGHVAPSAVLRARPRRRDPGRALDALALLAPRIAAFALRSQRPAIAGFPEFADAGGLLAYGPSLAEMFRRAATYVDKIPKGTRPSDLPVERPAKLDLVINPKTAETLGLRLPQALLLRADRLIQ